MENSICLCTCAWDNLKPRTVSEFLNLIGSGLIKHYVCAIGSLLPLARNQAICDALNHAKDFTHVLFVDGDMSGVTTHLVSELIKADKDLISPVMTKRVPPFTPAMDLESLPKLFKELEKDLPSRLPIQVPQTGFGCILIKRKVIDALMEKVGNKYLWFTNDRLPRKDFWGEIDQTLADFALRSFPEDDMLEIIRKIYKEGVSAGLSAHIGSEYVGEDFNFCHRATKKGFEVWVHSGQYVSHIGDQEYNIKDFIDYQEMKSKCKDEKELRLVMQTSKVSVWSEKILRETTHG